MASGVIILALFFLLFFSLKERIKQKILKERACEGLETKPSPLSDALGQMLATAGGIYLSLVMLFSFIEIEAPDKIILFSLELEPLATVSLFLSILQPFVLKLRFFK